MQIVIDAKGTIRHVYDEALLGLADAGRAVTRRASYVEPAGDGWTADLAPVGGPVLGPYRLRSKALAAEKAWLEEHDSPEPKG